MPVSKETQYKKVLELKKNNPEWTVAKCCASAGVKYYSFYGWYSKQKRKGGISTSSALGKKPEQTSVALELDLTRVLEALLKTGQMTLSKEELIKSLPERDRTKVFEEIGKKAFFERSTSDEESTEGGSASLS